jgi:signal peptidase II
MTSPSPDRNWPLITRVIALDIVLMLFLVDQLSKWLVLETMIRPEAFGSDAPQLDFLSWIMALSRERLPFVDISICQNFNLVMVWNTGISFGLFSEHGTTSALMLLAPLAIIVAAFGSWMIMTRDHVLRFALAVIVGGALGNLWDRVRFGAVADFLDFHIGDWHYPAFNVADSCIVLGIIALVGYELLYVKKRSTN